MSLNLFLTAPKDSGKGALAKLIAEKYNLTCISLGDIFVSEINAGSGFGIEIKKYLDAEAPLPDDLVFDILLSRLTPINFANFIVSGYPKTLNQSRVLEFYFRKHNYELSAVISLGADELVTEFFTKKNKLISIKPAESPEATLKAISLQIDKLNHV